MHAERRRWLADVGFGSGLIEPLPFDDSAPQTQDGWTYELLRAGPRAWQLRERQVQEWAMLYTFDDQRQHAADMVVANYFTSSYPRSAFVTQLVVMRKDAESIRRLTGRCLTITRPGHPDEERDLSDAEVADALHDIFGLPLGPEELAHLIATLPAPALDE